MARIRYLKPEFFTDEDLAELKYETRITFAGLWCHADKAGRMEDRPKFLKAMIFPYDNVDIEKQLEALSKPKNSNGTPFIIRYTVESHRYIEIVHWDKHQKPHHTEKDSTFPPAPPLTEKGMEKGMGMEKQDKGNGELNNGVVTVKKPLRSGDKEPPSPDVRTFIDFYHHEFENHFGKPPLIEGGKDGAIIKGLLKLIPIEELKELLLRMFEHEDPFIQKSGYTIGVFKSQINKLRIKPKPQGFRSERLFMKMTGGDDGEERQETVSSGLIEDKGITPRHEAD